MTSTAYMRFYAELNDFLAFDKRQVTFAHSFYGFPAVKDLIESVGVPHTEVDLVLIDGHSVDFYCRVCSGNRISVYPVFEALDISPLLKVRPIPLREPRFVLDTHLGKLASYLRMLGFDSLYENDYSDEELADISASEHRILLTRDRGLLKRSKVTHGYLVRAEFSRKQVREVLRRFDLFNAINPFGRCMRCNKPLTDVALNEVRSRVPQRVKESLTEYRQCTGCDRIYWKGTHYDKMAKYIKSLKSE